MHTVRGCVLVAMLAASIVSGVAKFFTHQHARSTQYTLSNRHRCLWCSLDRRLDLHVGATNKLLQHL